jgi:hypothetical protein
VAVDAPTRLNPSTSPRPCRPADCPNSAFGEQRSDAVQGRFAARSRRRAERAVAAAGARAARVDRHPPRDERSSLPSVWLGLRRQAANAGPAPARE